MGRLVRVLVAATSVLAALSPTVTAAGETDIEFVNRLVFSIPLADFVTLADHHGTPEANAGRFDWSTDGCSAPLVGDTGRSFDFSAACRRHDFGYRNTQLVERRSGQDVWNGGSRKAIDQQFLRDMKQHCKHRRLIDRPTCVSWAYTFYGVVRAAGGP